MRKSEIQYSEIPTRSTKTSTETKLPHAPCNVNVKTLVILCSNRNSLNSMLIPEDLVAIDEFPHFQKKIGFSKGLLNIL